MRQDEFVGVCLMAVVDCGHTRSSLFDLLATHKIHVKTVGKTFQRLINAAAVLTGNSS